MIFTVRWLGTSVTPANLPHSRLIFTSAAWRGKALPRDDSPHTPELHWQDLCQIYANSGPKRAYMHVGVCSPLQSDSSSRNR